MLESGTENIATKAISWVPFVGANIPDEVKRMRIKLVAAIIDTRTGQWETYSPEPFEDTSFSNQLDRAASHDEQVLAAESGGLSRLSPTASPRSTAARSHSAAATPAPSWRDTRRA